MDGGSPSEPCQPSDARSSGSWLHTVNWIKGGNQKVPETRVVFWHYNGVLPLQSVLVFANSETETCLESCIVHFPTTSPCSTIVDVLQTGDVPILFFPSSDEKFGYDFRT